MFGRALSDTTLDWFCCVLNMEIYPLNPFDGLFYERHAEPFPGYTAPVNCRKCHLYLSAACRFDQHLYRCTRVIRDYLDARRRIRGVDP